MLLKILLLKSTPYVDEITGIISVDFDETDQQLVTCSVSYNEYSSYILWKCDEFTMFENGSNKSHVNLHTWRN